MSFDRCLLPALLLALVLSACVATRAEQRVAAGMSGAEVKRVLGQPYSQSRAMKNGVAVDMWLYREVRNEGAGRRVLVDSAVSLRDGHVVEVTALKETPAEDAAVAPGEVLGRE